MRCLFGCPDIVSLTDKFLMARNFFNIFIENNPVQGTGKNIICPTWTGLKKKKCTKQASRSCHNHAYSIFSPDSENILFDIHFQVGVFTARLKYPHPDPLWLYSIPPPSMFFSKLVLFVPSPHHLPPAHHLPPTHPGLGVAVMNGMLYAAGGHSGSAYLDLTECYDPYSDKWSVVRNMMNCRCNFAFAALWWYHSVLTKWIAMRNLSVSVTSLGSCLSLIHVFERKDIKETSEANISYQQCKCEENGCPHRDSTSWMQFT